MKSQYLGLWKCERTGWYMSQPITKKQLKEIKGKLRIIMRYNKYHNPEKNTPRFIFAFADAESAENVVSLKFDSDEFEEMINSLEEAKRLVSLAVDGAENYDDNYYYIDKAEQILSEILEKIN